MKKDYKIRHFMIYWGLSKKSIYDIKKKNNTKEESKMEKNNRIKRKQNMKIYSLYRMLSLDRIFIFNSGKKYKCSRCSIKIFILCIIYDYSSNTSNYCG